MPARFFGLCVASALIVFIAPWHTAKAQYEESDLDTPTLEPPSFDQPEPATPPEPTPPPAPDREPSRDAPEAISPQEWQAGDWELVEPTRTALVELDGYFRMRFDTFRNMDFGNQSVWEAVPRYPAASDGNAHYASSNMRLRLEPILNLTDTLQIVTTFDIFDNLVLGSTPDTVPTGGATPINILSRRQMPPREGVNAFTDSILVRRAYARLTVLREQVEFKFGRMPDHWGLGMWTNDGDCLDCDFGNVVDRVAATVNIADHLITPMFTWVSSGPLFHPFGQQLGQPIDGVTWDDVSEYGLRIQRVDSTQRIQERLMQGEAVVNYGLWAMLRRQARDFPANFWSETEGRPGAEIPTAEVNYVRRDSDVFMGNGYLKLHIDQIEIGAEFGIIYGSFRDEFQQGVGAPLRTTNILQMGGALDAIYRFKDDYDGLSLQLRAGAASGDPAPGFGALDQADTQRGPDGTPDGDTRLTNFQFSPDYHVDLLLFRRMIGTVTDAWYIRPSATYEFGNDLAGTFAVIYSQAIERTTTPGLARPLGVELNAAVTYGLGEKLFQNHFRDFRDGFKAALLGGVLWPLGGFRNLNLEPEEQGGSLAWTVQGRLYLTF